MTRGGGTLRGTALLPAGARAGRRGPCRVSEKSGLGLRDDIRQESRT